MAPRSLLLGGSLQLVFDTLDRFVDVAENGDLSRGVDVVE